MFWLFWVQIFTSSTIHRSSSPTIFLYGNSFSKIQGSLLLSSQNVSRLQQWTPSQNIIANHYVWCPIPLREPCKLGIDVEISFKICHPCCIVLWVFGVYIRTFGIDRSSSRPSTLFMKNYLQKWPRPSDMSCSSCAVGKPEAMKWWRRFAEFTHVWWSVSVRETWREQLYVGFKTVHSSMTGLFFLWV